MLNEINGNNIKVYWDEIEHQPITTSLNVATLLQSDHDELYEFIRSLSGKMPRTAFYSNYFETPDSHFGITYIGLMPIIAAYDISCSCECMNEILEAYFQEFKRVEDEVTAFEMKMAGLRVIKDGLEVGMRLMKKDGTPSSSGATVEEYESMTDEEKLIHTFELILKRLNENKFYDEEEKELIEECLDIAHQMKEEQDAA